MISVDSSHSPNRISDQTIEPTAPEASIKLKLIQAAKIVGAVMFGGALLWGGGHLMVEGGKLLCSAAVSNGNGQIAVRLLSGSGAVLKGLGSGIAMGGKAAFLTCAVPIYFAGWVVPKWIVTEGLPQAALLAKDWVVIPMIKGMAKCAGLLKEALVVTTQAINKYALKPLANLIVNTVRFAWNSVVVPIVKGFVQALGLVKDVLVATIQAINNYALKPLANLIVNVTRFAWNSVVVPIVKEVVQALGLVKDALVATIQAINKYALKPLVNAITTVGRLLANWIIKPVFNLTAKLLQFCAGHIVKSAAAVNNYVLLPVARVTAAGLRATVHGVANSVTWARSFSFARSALEC
ncbi:MAG: hypothetical protein E6Q59_07370 [Nitrosomonas sp.]|nr:MAG: hypothetical protein E6Q59_07370 [Nitrosomonas sp.]